MSAVFVYLRSGHLGAAARASAQAIEIAAGLTPHHRLHAAGWQILLASVTGRWDEVRAQTAEAERVVDANLAAATPCVATVSILLNCATASALAGDEDEARRLESKADGIGMEGDRWYQGWFDPPKIRLALARHDLGEVAELASHELDWEWEPASTYLDALAALGDRERIEAEAAEVAATGNASPSHSRSGRSASPAAIGHCSGRRWSDSRQCSSPGTQSRRDACCKALGAWTCPGLGPGSRRHRSLSCWSRLTSHLASSTRTAGPVPVSQPEGLPHPTAEHPAGSCARTRRNPHAARLSQ